MRGGREMDLPTASSAEALSRSGDLHAERVAAIQAFVVVEEVGVNGLADRRTTGQAAQRGAYDGADKRARRPQRGAGDSPHLGTSPHERSAAGGTGHCTNGAADFLAEVSGANSGGLAVGTGW